MTGQRLRFGIVGCGAIAPTHASAIRQLGHIVAAVADPLTHRARRLAEQFAVPRVYADAAELAADPELDVVCVCTPSGLHAEHGVAALSAGKHVIVEKPMDVSHDACDRLIRAADRADRKLSVISQHRFDAASLLAYRLIQSGELGQIVLATADVKWWRSQQYYDEGDWRGTWRFDGGGALMNQGIHTVDLLQWLCGGVRAVRAATATLAHQRIEVEDVAVLSLELTNGAPASLVATTAAFDGQPVRIEIHGTGGSILLEGDNLKRVALTSGQVFQTHAAAEHAIRIAQGGTAAVRDEAVTRPTAPPGAAWGDAHRAQIEDFVRCVLEGGRPLIDGPSGRQPVLIALAAYESARRGGERVEIPPA
ncbi:MAG: Gfo/Idh/MocA family oxidoreductase [Phycisphaerae bacterium]|nr:Gfo/Idh/MocA family oxidoreductase [Phycisphaerae bacterium]MDW8262964.1 Gfo/Idh/MocA family oxidoreductase [Phycisphaerales bacterium]